MPLYDPTPTPDADTGGKRSPARLGRSRLARRPLAVITAPAVAAALWAIEVPLAGVRLGVRFGPSSTQVVGIGPILGASVVAGLAGWAALEAIEARAARPRRTWSVVALVALAASLGLPVGTAESATAMVALVGLHLAVGTTLILQLRASAATSSGRVPRGDGSLALGQRWSPSSRTAVLVVLAALVAGGAFAALSRAATASGFGPPAGGPFGLASRVVPEGGWGPGGLGVSGWGRPVTRDTEVFEVASTNPAGPGSIILTGVVDAGGVEHPGRAIDSASFADGGFRIDHGSGHPTEHFDATTCVGTISQVGSFDIVDGTGRFADLTGTGHYVFRATYTTARDAAGCNKKAMTAYIETIHGAVGLTPSVVHQLTATKS